MKKISVVRNDSREQGNSRWKIFHSIVKYTIYTIHSLAQSRAASQVIRAMDLSQKIRHQLHQMGINSHQNMQKVKMVVAKVTNRLIIDYKLYKKAEDGNRKYKLQTKNVI